MRILQISSVKSIGGGERYLAHLANILSKRGHEVYAVVAPDSPLIKEFSKIPPENILTSRMRNALDFISALEIAQFARQNGIEIIHAHLARDYPLAAIASRIAKIPYVLTRHVLFPLNRFHKFALREVKYIISPSNAVAAALKKQNLFPPEKIVTIRYAVDVNHFSNLEKRLNENFCVGTIGNLDRVKGHDVFIRAASIIAQKRSDVRFVIVGEDRSSSGKNKRELENFISELNLTDKIKLAGWASDVREAFREFDIFALASRSESFGFVIVEAMLSGVPVIATATEGAKEIIENDSYGEIVPIDDAEKLAQAILDLLENETKRKRLAENAQKYASENFSLEKMVDATEEIYRKVLLIH